jgi:Spy/CpxP family protein refolding chaperone
MVEENRGTQAGGTPLWKRRSVWLGGGLIAGLAAVAVAAPSVLHGAGGHGGFGRGGFGHGGFGRGGHGFGAQMLKDPDAAKRHAGMAVEWALRGVEATDEQKQQARRITDRLIDELGPLVAQHRDERQAIRRALAGAEVDREALEQARRRELTLADQASKLVVDRVADLAEVLTPQQRQELATFAHGLHGEPGK